jgi:hypothetical protein
MTLGSFNLVSDIFILILPQRIIWRLNMSREKKIGIALMFAVGLMQVAFLFSSIFSPAKLT